MFDLNKRLINYFWRGILMSVWRMLRLRLDTASCQIKKKLGGGSL
jgi:hypothetical protein